MKYVEQSYKQLRLLISEDESNLYNFSIISEAFFAAGDMHFHYGILSESHFVIIKTAMDSFNEIFACTDTEISNTECHMLGKIHDKSVRRNLKSFGSYTFSPKVYELDAAHEHIDFLRSKRSNPETHYLEHTFPTLHATETPAVTEVYVTIKNDVHIQSLHTYPNENIAVISSSVISQKN